MIRSPRAREFPEPHYHSLNQFMICLSGKYEYTWRGRDRGQLLLQSQGQRARPGDEDCGDRGL